MMQNRRFKKFKIGTFKDGSPKYTLYLVKHSHSSQPKIRRIMYWAHQYKWDMQMLKKYHKDLETYLTQT